MYISVYDEFKNHLANIDNVTFDLTRRVYDLDNFSATGTCDVDINDAKYLILNDNLGNYQYSCFCNGITPDGELRTIKGQDFRTLFDTEILLDYTKHNSFHARLYDIFGDVCKLIFNNTDPISQKINVEFNIAPNALSINTELYFGTMQDTYKIVNAYKFLKAYLKVYEYSINTKFDPYENCIIFDFIKVDEVISIDLSDFLSKLETTSNDTNKAVATLKFNPLSEDSEGNPVITPRPSDLATKYYYRTTDNQIIESNEAGNFADWQTKRIYPVSQKIFEAEYLADAQYDAVYELANTRYVDNIILDNNALIDPIDLSNYPLYTMFELYYDGKFYKSLPLTEKQIKVDGSGKSTKIKLGFKKILITEIIKGG